jgi:hypothetical protein
MTLRNAAAGQRFDTQRGSIQPSQPTAHRRRPVCSLEAQLGARPSSVADQHRWACGGHCSRPGRAYKQEAGKRPMSTITWHRHTPPPSRTAGSGTKLIKRPRSAPAAARVLAPLRAAPQLRSCSPIAPGAILTALRGALCSPSAADRPEGRPPLQSPCRPSLARSVRSSLAPAIGRGSAPAPPASAQGRWA